MAIFDAAHADNKNGRSTCGYLFLLFGAPISWSSKVQCTAALSTTEAELMACAEATREATWIKSLIDALFALHADPRGKSPSGSIVCELLERGDNQGALAS